jgi:adenylate cyclase
MEHFEQALLLYDPQRHRDYALRYSQNSAVGARCHGALALWFLGQPDRALGRIEEALTLARELSEPHGLAHTLFFAAHLHQLRGEARTVQELAKAAIAVSGEHGLALYKASASITSGWALAEQGTKDEAIEQIRQGLAAHQATGTRSMRPYFLALLAEALGRAHKTAEGLHVLDEALAITQGNGERFYQAELYRLRGELLLMQSTPRVLSRAATGGKAALATASSAVANAKACFDDSIKISRRQKAKSLELRAATSLARLYQNQGRPKEAESLLAQTYDGFTEGFDTKDLREAKALLDALRGT